MNAMPIDEISSSIPVLVRTRVKVEVVSERSPRTMNHMDPDTRVVHARLEAWGKWAKDCGLRTWPEASLLGRLIEQGASGAAQQGKPPISMPDEIAAVDGAVARLCVIDRKAVQTYYLRWEPIEVMARRNAMRVRQFQNVLRRARWRIALSLAEKI